MTHEVTTLDVSAFPEVAKLVVKTRLKSNSNTRTTYTPRSRNQLTTAVLSSEAPAAAVLLLILITPIVAKMRTLASGDRPH